MKPAAASLIGVVDDDENVLESIADLLASAGYAAATYPSATAVLESADLMVIGCLISDIWMPGLNGWQLLRRIREVRPNLPVVLMTAHDVPECDRRADLEGIGVLQLFRKPFDPQLLLTAVRTALSAPPPGQSKP